MALRTAPETISARSLCIVHESFVGLQVELGAEHLITDDTASLSAVHG